MKVRAAFQNGHRPMWEAPSATNSQSAGQPDRRRVNMPAWTLSAGLHLAFFLLLACFVRPPSNRSAPEPDRSVSIVLAKRSAANQTEYFTSDDEDRAANQAAAGESAEKIEARTDPVGNPLPSAAAAESLLLDVDLPKPPDGHARADANPGDLLRLHNVDSSGRPQILPGLGNDEILANDPLRNRVAGPTGPTTSVTLFGRTGVGRSFVFLIDRSKSMGGHGLGAIAAAQTELVRELAHLEPDHRFQVIAYNQGLRRLSRSGMVEASKDNKDLVEHFLRETVAAGGTAHEPALTAALRLRPDVVFVLTDGGEPHLSEPEIDLLTRENRGHTTVHCLHFGSGPLQQPDNFLSRFASRNGGGYGYVDMMQAGR